MIIRQAANPNRPVRVKAATSVNGFYTRAAMS